MVLSVQPLQVSECRKTGRVSTDQAAIFFRSVMVAERRIL
jgi:hypothetical protein